MKGNKIAYMWRTMGISRGNDPISIRMYYPYVAIFSWGQGRAEIYHALHGDLIHEIEIGDEDEVDDWLRGETKEASAYVLRD